MQAEQTLAKLGHSLPETPRPMANYIPTRRVGTLLYTAGMGPTVGGEIKLKGKLGRDLTLEQGVEAARLTILNLLSALKAELGDLDKIEHILKLTGYVNSAPGFDKQPLVINGASDLLVQVFGERGKHARTSIGVSELPNGIPVEIDLVVEVAESQ